MNTPPHPPGLPIHEKQTIALFLMSFSDQTRCRYEPIFLLRSGRQKGAAFNSQQIIHNVEKYSSFNWIRFFKNQVEITVSKQTVPPV